MWCNYQCSFWKTTLKKKFQNFLWNNSWFNLQTKCLFWFQLFFFFFFFVSPFFFFFFFFAVNNLISFSSYCCYLFLLVWVTNFSYKHSVYKQLPFKSKSVKKLSDLDYLAIRNIKKHYRVINEHCKQLLPW